MKLKKSAFTLIEVLVSITVVSIVLIVGFQTYTFIFAGKIRLIERTNLQKEAIFFTERLFQTIKLGGTIDYEEYFNRKVVGTTTSSGHYDTPTGFGNFGNSGNPGTPTYGNGFYYCRSGDGIFNKMTSTGGCFEGGGLMANASGTTITPGSNDPQRYGQYSFQFIDYNSDHNSDDGDVNFDGSILRDDDDEDLGNGPRVFTGGVDVKELYLISGDKKTRTYFRHNVKRDPDAPSSATCDISLGTGSGCLGNIQFLKLVGKDWGLDHNSGSTDITQNDGVVDTWLLAPGFGTYANEVADSNSTDSYWKDLFPSNINVSKFEVYPVPNIEESRAWNITDTEASSIKVSPYVTLNIELKPSFEIQKKIKGKTTPFSFNTTINLTEIFSK